MSCERGSRRGRSLLERKSTRGLSEAALIWVGRIKLLSTSFLKTGGADLHRYVVFHCVCYD